MNKKIVLLALSVALTACGDNDLVKIQEKTVSNDNSITWKQATDKYQHCIDESKKWNVGEVKKAKSADIEVVKTTFSCNLKKDLINQYNKKTGKDITSATLQLVFKTVTAKGKSKVRSPSEKLVITNTDGNKNTILSVQLLGNGDWIVNDTNPLTNAE